MLQECYTDKMPDKIYDKAAFVQLADHISIFRLMQINCIFFLKERSCF